MGQGDWRRQGRGDVAFLRVVRHACKWPWIVPCILARKAGSPSPAIKAPFFCKKVAICGRQDRDEPKQLQGEDGAGLDLRSGPQTDRAF